MAKRHFRRIDSFLSFRYYERRAENRAKEAWKERTGRETARGWNNSPERGKYLEGRFGRIEKYAERNPESFLKYADRITKDAIPGVEQKAAYSGDITDPAYLNPMLSKGGTIAEKMIQAAELRASATGKKLVMVGEMKWDMGGITGSATFTGRAGALAAHIEMMKDYAAAIAGFPVGISGLIASDYKFKTTESSGVIIMVFRQMSRLIEST